MKQFIYVIIANTILYASFRTKNNKKGPVIIWAIFLMYLLLSSIIINKY